MKADTILLKMLISTIVVYLFAFNNCYSQSNGFFLNPTGTTESYMQYIRKAVLYNSTYYYTAYLNLSSYKNITTGVLSDAGDPVQKIQLQGGNILLCRTQSAPNGPNLNPTSRNGAILFGDNITPAYDLIHGKWGIEYDDQYSTGGLNFFKPKSSLTATRINHSLFIRNDGYVGINTAMPLTRLHVEGEVTVTALASRDKLVSADATGKLILVDKPDGDNMGNCEATHNLKMFDYSILNGTINGGKLLERADGSTFNPGLRFSADNSMILETGQSARLALVSGTSTPSAVWVSNWSSGGFGLVLNANNRTGGIYRDANNPTVAIGFNSTTVGIGIIPPDESKYALYVAGGILATEVKVQLQTEWKDLVFLPDYKLRTIKEVETYISENGHLPEIPNSETVKNEGINIGEMNALLLQKIEELTLYIIDQQKQIDELKIYIQK